MLKSSFCYRLFGPDFPKVINANIKLVVEDVHTPYTGALTRDVILAKSYIWWLDDPWAALIALAAISILLCIVGIIVLVFTHSRYVTSLQ
jgi:hypothetical protein